MVTPHIGRGWKITRALTVRGLVIILFWPTLLWLVRQWLNNDYYAHGPLIPLVSAVLLWRRWGTAQPTKGTAYAGSLIPLLGISGNIRATSIRAPYLSALCLVVVLSGLILLLRGQDALYRVAFPLAFLIAAIPPPFVERIGTSLQVTTAQWAGQLVSFLGLEVTQTGSQLSLDGCSFIVGAPCSGLRSLVTFASLVALLLYMTRGPWLAKVLLAPTGSSGRLAGQCAESYVSAHRSTVLGRGSRAVLLPHFLRNCVLCPGPGHIVSSGGSFEVPRDTFRYLTAILLLLAGIAGTHIIVRGDPFGFLRPGRPNRLCTKVPPPTIATWWIWIPGKPRNVRGKSSVLTTSAYPPS